MARYARGHRLFSAVKIVVFVFLWRVCSGGENKKDADFLLQHDGLRLEQFLWTGSGDGEDFGPNAIHPTPPVVITTIFHTTTIHTTVFPPSVFTTSSAMLPGNDPDDCFGGQDCYDIHPSPTLKPPPGHIFPPWPPPLPSIPDERYWIVTVLKTHAAQFYLTPAEIEPRLARLYKIAFHRSQERHLGINGSNNYWNSTSSLLLAKEVIKNRIKRREDVSVRVHNVTSNGRLQLLYSVRVDGKPVLAEAAVKDMRLVTDNEVTAELGHPVLSKAEPYLKENLTPLLSGQSKRPGETWFLVGLSIFLIIILFGLCLIGYLTLTKWQTNQNRRSANQRHIFEREIRSGRGLRNFGYKSEVETTNEMESSRIVPLHSRSSRDSTGSESSLVKPSPAQRSSILKQTAPEPRPRSQHVQSPKSYLSMPSVKSFPRGAEMPEPLSHMLEHEDVPSSVLPSQPPLTRHKSVEGDPDLAPSPTGDEDEILSEPNMSVGGMRKRFHELLDDAFSLFSSKSSSIDSERNSPPQTSPTTGENRSKSAVIRPVCVEVVTPDSHLRPRTSTDLIPVRPSTSNGMASPRGAWDTNPSTPGSRPHARPLSAGPFHRPTLEPAIVLADGVLSPSDPAVPLIEAIKRELDRFPPVTSASERRPLQHPDHSYA
ncbi:hypothetical protein M8J76_000425 [Diaphorina citri]|nr:hypothetical protein M8J76_000425 [Diaphorina citri]